MTQNNLIFMLSIAILTIIAMFVFKNDFSDEQDAQKLACEMVKNGQWPEEMCYNSKE